MALQVSCFPSSSSSSSFSYEWPYHVFLSFRGSDTRHGFTGNLYKALTDKGIRTFFDDQELQGGEEITPALVKAIKDSRIAIVVFSVNYASSSFCLHELATIMEFVKGKGRLVLPVFYDVDPCDVRHQRGRFGEAMTKLEERFKHDMEKVQKWKEALLQAANLSGKDFKLGNEYEYACIEKIVKMISEKISRVALYIADYPVGLESRVLEVNSLLNDGIDCGVRMVGIYGIGGIGKTTLARAIYNFVADQFEGLCFLENVREKSIKLGLVHLQETLLSEMLGDKDIRLGSVYRGIPIIKQKLHGKKVLLVLDDVDEFEQLRATIGEADWLGSGSRVIITTRDKHLLTSHGIDRNYKVEGLSKKEALELLGLKAFKNENIDPSYMDILKHAVTYACGLPLALEVIGSNLFGKSIDECRSVLAQYERIPNKKIQKILEISFDSLEECHKKIFLDVACCFNGYNWVEVQDILYARHDVFLNNGISVLIQKSLLMPDKYGYLTIHDLIRDMGKEIIRQESPKHPGNRSRLWIPEDVVQVLEEKTGTSELEIMILDASKLEKIVVEWNGKSFKKMKNLEILIIRNTHFSQGAKHLPNSLRVLEWWNYPSNSLPFDFYPKKLAICNLPESSLMSVGFIKKRKVMNLKVLKLDKSNIEYIPDVSGVPNLETLSFVDCGNLIKVHKSVGFLDKLSQLGVSGCSKLRSFPALMLPCVKVLDFIGCSSLENFPEILGDMEGLAYVYLYSTSIKELPYSFTNLRNLESLKIGHVDGVLRLSSSTSMLHTLNVQGCGKLQFPIQDEDEGQGSSTVSSTAVNFSFEFCNTIDEFFAMFLSLSRHVVTLDLSGNDFTILPENIKELCSLRKLTLDDCKKLGEIRGIPPNIQEFSTRNCISLRRMLLNELMNLKVLKFDNSDIEYIPDVSGVPNLEELSFRDCGNLIKVHKSIGFLDKLSQLGVSGCSKLRSFPALMLPCLAELNFMGCSSLDNFPEILGDMEALAHVYLTDTSIKELPYSFTNLWNLKSLTFGNLLNDDFNVRGCGKLQFRKQDEDGGQGSSMFSSIAVKFSFDTLDEFFAMFRYLSRQVVTLDLSGNNFTILLESIKELCLLRKLTLDDCKKLGEIRGIPPNIEEFSTRNCISLRRMLLNELMNLKVLKFDNSDIEYIPDVSGVPNLEELSFRDCGNLFKVHKSIGFLHKLSQLGVSGCSKLRSFPALMLPCLAELNFMGCSSLENFPEILGDMEALAHVYLTDTSIKELPYSFTNLWNLKSLTFGNLLNDDFNVRGCGELQFRKQDEDGGQGSSMFSSIAVKFSFDTLDEFFAMFRYLSRQVVTLDLSGNDFTILPESIRELCLLRKLTLNDCEELREIRGIPPNIEEFSAAYCMSLTIFPESIEELCSLRKLTLDGCEELREIRGIPPNIEEFSAANCVSLTILPESIKELCSLRKLTLDGCKELREIRGIPPNIEEFSAANCVSLTILPESIKELCSLRKLTLDGCEELREIRGIPPNIEEFSAANCMSLTPSCRSMLLNEEYYSRNVYKRSYLPGGSIPKWFEHSNRNSISFWFRNKPPSISACVVRRQARFGTISVGVSIPGNKTLAHWKEFYDCFPLTTAEDHITIFNLGRILSDHELAHELLSENEWTRVCIVVSRGSWELKEFPLNSKIGIHVHKHESNMEDIRFTDPLLQEKEVNMGDFHRDAEQEKNLTTLASVETQQGKRLLLHLPQAMNSLDDNVNGDLNSDSSCHDNLCTLRLGLDSEVDSDSDSIMSFFASDTDSDGRKQSGNDNDSWQRDKKLLSLRPCWEEPFDCENSELNLKQLASTSDNIRDQGYGERSRKRKRSALMLDLNNEPIGEMDLDSDSVMARLASNTNGEGGKQPGTTYFST